MSMIYCPACRFQVSRRAVACPSCGEPIAARFDPTAPTPTVVRVEPLWSPGIAAVLSFFIPGLGQLYKGQIINAIAWFVFVPVGYFFFFIPGLILHLFCIIGATMGDPRRY